MSRTIRGGSAATVCRGDSGNHLGSSSLVIYVVHDVGTSNAIVCREAFSLSKDILLHNFIIASVSKQVVGDINKGNIGHYGSTLVRLSSEQLCSIVNISLKGVPRMAMPIVKPSFRIL